MTFILYIISRPLRQVSMYYHDTEYTYFLGQQKISFGVKRIHIFKKKIITKNSDKWYTIYLKFTYLFHMVTTCEKMYS